MSPKRNFGVRVREAFLEDERVVWEGQGGLAEAGPQAVVGGLWRPHPASPSIEQPGSQDSRLWQLQRHGLHMCHWFDVLRLFCFLNFHTHVFSPSPPSMAPWQRRRG